MRRIISPNLPASNEFSVQIVPPEVRERLPKRKIVRSLAQVLYPAPLSALRALGPYGPRFTSRARPDIVAKFRHFLDDPEVFSTYMYHCNAQHPSGEMAFSVRQELSFFLGDYF